MKVKIVTDSACDLPLSYVRENNIEVVSLKVNINDEFMEDDLGETLKYDWLYEQIRTGVMPKTAQANAYEFEEVFKKYINEGYAIICITLAGVLSGTYNSANIAKDSIVDENKDADITVIDSTSVTSGLGAIVYYANDMLKLGKSKNEIIDWIELNKRCINHSIVIDDLTCLKHGGRISSTTALVGGLLNIKPTISLDNDGRLVPGTKIKGKKKVLKYLANEVKEKAINLENQVVFISHGDCLEEAEALKEIILSENQVEGVMINYIGSTIGCHGGPGALVAAFIGEERV